jgi:hypothetical protein
MRFFGTLLLFLGIALVLVTLIFGYAILSETGGQSGLDVVGLLGAGAAASLGIGTMARRR